MGSEDLINIQSSCSSGNRSDNNDLSSADGEPSVADSLPSNSKVKEDQLNGNFPGNENAVGNKDTQSLASEIHKDLIDSTTVNQVSVELTEAFEIQGKMNSFISTVHTENGCLNVQDESSVGMLKRDRSSISCQEKDSNSCQPYLVSRDLKWPFMRNKLQFMSCIIPYKDSKRKLEKLLQQWSEWHAGHYPSSHVRLIHLPYCLLILIFLSLTSLLKINRL